MNTAFNNFVKLSIDISTAKCSFLIDTGADISLLKANIVKGSTIVNTDTKCNITGISTDNIPTLGSTDARIILTEEKQIIQTFQLVEKDVHIPTDGILGRDFLVKYHCKIDYDTWLLSGHDDNETFEFAIESDVDGDIFIPARCEVFRKLDLGDSNNTYLVKSKQIKKGVFLANSIVDTSFPYVKILNTNNLTVRLSKNFTISKRNLQNYDIFKFNENVNNDNRNTKLINELKLENIPNKARDKLVNLCKDFNEIFSLKSDHLTTNNFYKQRINLEDPRPVYIKNYRTPEAQIEETSAHIRKMLDDGIIRDSTSPYNSPILLVPKKSATGETKSRLVVDFRQLNKKILGDKFPLPRIDEILDHLGRAKYFTTLDLTSGFHQIELEEESKKYTAFSSTSGHYEFNRLPFGLNISPNSFQRMMIIALSGLPPECAFLYIDDIIVVGCSVDHHISNLKNVFEKLRHYNLKLNPSKCNFFKSDVTYLGHHVSEKGIQPDKTKYEVIQKYPKPENADDVRRFVAFANYYRRFIPQFAQIAHPLNRLLRKNQTFVWSDICEKAFQEIKSKLLSPEILQFPDYNKEFIVTTDASKIACGAILSQNHGDIDLPISFASRTFTKGESNKSTIEQELLAIHWAITHFRPYLYGRRFIVRTDHRPLVYLFSMKDPSSRLTRMRLDLEEFNFEVHYVPGKSNVGADALSRIVIDIDELKEMYVRLVQTRARAKNNALQSDSTNNKTDHLKVFESININEVYNIPKLLIEKTKLNHVECLTSAIKNKKYKKTLRHAIMVPFKSNNVYDTLKQLLEKVEAEATVLKIEKLALALSSTIFNSICSSSFIKVANETLKNITIILFHPRREIKDLNQIIQIIKENHDSALGGHVGVNRLYRKLKTMYMWKNMKNSIKDYIKKCTKCKENKHTTKTIERFTHTTTPQKPFMVVALDTIGPFTRSNSGNRYALTIQCDLSKYIIIKPIPDKQAISLAKAFVENCILIYGAPSFIRTDQGTEFKNETFCKINDLLQITHKLSTPYHPETIGSLERNHRCLNEFVRQFVNENHTDWDVWLPYYTFVYNTTPHTDFIYTPFELVFGHSAGLPQHITNIQKLDPIYNLEDYYSELKHKLQLAAIKTKQMLDKQKQKRISQQIVNPLQLQINDRVMLANENRTKLDKIFKGPFIVVEINHPNVKIFDPSTKKEQIVHKNRIKLY